MRLVDLSFPVIDVLATPASASPSISPQLLPDWFSSRHRCTRYGKRGQFLISIYWTHKDKRRYILHWFVFEGHPRWVAMVGEAYGFTSVAPAMAMQPQDVTGLALDSVKDRCWHR